MVGRISRRMRSLRKGGKRMSRRMSKRTIKKGGGRMRRRIRRVSKRGGQKIRRRSLRKSKIIGKRMSRQIKQKNRSKHLKGGAAKAEAEEDALKDFKSSHIKKYIQEKLKDLPDDIKNVQSSGKTLIDYLITHYSEGRGMMGKVFKPEPSTTYRRDEQKREINNAINQYCTEANKGKQLSEQHDCNKFSDILQRAKHDPVRKARVHRQEISDEDVEVVTYLVKYFSDPKFEDTEIKQVINTRQLEQIINTLNLDENTQIKEDLITDSFSITPLLSGPTMGHKLTLLFNKDVPKYRAIYDKKGGTPKTTGGITRSDRKGSAYEGFDVDTIDTQSETSADILAQEAVYEVANEPTGGIQRARAASVYGFEGDMGKQAPIVPEAAYAVSEPHTESVTSGGIKRGARKGSVYMGFDEGGEDESSTNANEVTQTDEWVMKYLKSTPTLFFQTADIDNIKKINKQQAQQVIKNAPTTDIKKLLTKFFINIPSVYYEAELANPATEEESSI
jgi:hypothetical protein